MGFAGGTATGVEWDPRQESLRLSQTGSPTNTAELDSSWTPKWANLVWNWGMNGSGALAASVAPDRGSGTCNVWDTYFSNYAPAKLRSGVTFPSQPGFDPGQGGFNCAGTGIEILSDKMTVGGWIKHVDVTPLAWKLLVTSHDTAGWWLQRNNTTSNLMIMAETDLGTQYCGNTTMPALDGKWHYVAYTLSTGSMDVYLDGELKQHCTYNHGAGFAAPTVGLSIRSATDDGSTTYDDWAVWHDQLSATDIKVIYDRQSAKYSGTFTSRVMDAHEVAMDWDSLSWVPTLPFAKELPDAACDPGPNCVHSQNESSGDYPALVGSAGSTGDNDLMNGIVGLWHLNDAAGSGSVVDESGNGNNGFTAGGFTLGKKGKLQNAINLNGVLGYVGFGGSGTLEHATDSSHTQAAWVKIGAYPSQSCVTNSSVCYGAIFVRQGFHMGLTVAYGGLIQATAYDSANTAFHATSDANAVRPGEWHHLARVVNDATKTMQLYIDGLEVASTSFAGHSLRIYGNDPYYLGMAVPSHPLTNGSFAYPFNGSIDEAAIWSRALDPKEILQLYRRAANRVKVQVRTCAAPDCTDDPTGTFWKGPGGTNQTYFSELNNNSVPLNGSGFVKKGRPSMPFSSFTNPITTSRYFQYRAVLESDDTGSGCDYGPGALATWCSPELKSVSVDPIHYESSSPTVIGKKGVSYHSLASFSETLGASCSVGIGYNLGTGNLYSSAIWYWWNPSKAAGCLGAGTGAWCVSDGTVAQSNDASTVSSYANRFGAEVGSGTVYFKAFLKSTGSSACELDRLDLDGQP